jgi:hypothetical protein
MTIMRMRDKLMVCKEMESFFLQCAFYEHEKHFFFTGFKSPRKDNPVDAETKVTSAFTSLRMRNLSSFVVRTKPF